MGAAQNFDRDLRYVRLGNSRIAGFLPSLMTSPSSAKKIQLTDPTVFETVGTIESHPEATFTVSADRQASVGLLFGPMKDANDTFRLLGSAQVHPQNASLSVELFVGWANVSDVVAYAAANTLPTGS